MLRPSSFKANRVNTSIYLPSTYLFTIYSNATHTHTDTQLILFPFNIGSISKKKWAHKLVNLIFKIHRQTIMETQLVFSCLNPKSSYLLRPLVRGLC